MLNATDVNDPNISAVAETEELIIQLSPNPATNSFQLHLPQPAPPGAVLRLHDLAGRTVRTEKLPPGTTQHEVSVSGLAAGMYFYTVVFDNEQQWTGKIVVQR